MRTLIRIVLPVVSLLAGASPALAGDNSFAGLKFGIGLSSTFDTGSRDRVDEAEIDGSGRVRVLKTNNTVARIMLETHYFFQPKDWLGVGPFVAVQPGSNEVINALGIGLMFGLRRSDDDSASFNIGIGFSTDPSTKTLGDGFKENELAPTGPDGAPLPIRYKTVNQKGFLLLASFSWK